MDEPQESQEPQKTQEPQGVFSETLSTKDNVTVQGVSANERHIEI